MSWRSRRRSRTRDYGYGGFGPYVSVAEKRARSEKQAAKLTKKGESLSPVRLDGKTIARSFWGKSWCENLESYSDYANRLPRGRSYVRNGSVLHLEIRQGEVQALVSGSSLYKISIRIKPVAPDRWKSLCRASAGSIGSLIELLQGKLSEQVMGIMTHRETGLFPSPGDIELACSCPDWADMCKHVAAVLYGVGARLDEKPELLFRLRHVDHQELVSQADTLSTLTEAKADATVATLSAEDVGSVFGIEMEAAPAEHAAAPEAPRPAPARDPARKPASAARAKKKRVGKRRASTVTGRGKGTSPRPTRRRPSAPSPG